MIFKSIMHVSFFTEDMDRIRDFYENKLGLKPKMIVKFEAYKDKKDSAFYAKALSNPNDICIIYIEAAPGQFIEFFPKTIDQEPQVPWNSRIGYSHFSLLVDDIEKTKRELEDNGVEIERQPSIGNSHTWQMWIKDPDGNRIEIMQYTEDSYQIKGFIQ